MNVVINGERYVREADLPADRRPSDNRLLAALDVKFDSDAGEGLTVREYLHKLLEMVWVETEGFDGERPFGNSGWYRDVWEALAKAGFIKSTVKTYGNGNSAWTDVEIVDRAAADAFVRDIIRAMCFGVRAEG